MVACLDQDDYMCRWSHCNGRSKTPNGYCDKHRKRFDRVKKVLFSPKAAKRVMSWEYCAIYVMGFDEWPYVKIGRSRNPIRRAADMQVGSPYEIKIYGLRFALPEVIMAAEYEVHKTLGELDCHHRGEWFSVSPGDALAVIDKCATNRELPLMMPKDYDRFCMDMHVSELMDKPNWADDLRGDIISSVESNVAC